MQVPGFMGVLKQTCHAAANDPLGRTANIPMWEYSSGLGSAIAADPLLSPAIGFL